MRLNKVRLESIIKTPSKISHTQKRLGNSAKESRENIQTIRPIKYAQQSPIKILAIGKFQGRNPTRQIAKTKYKIEKEYSLSYEIWRNGYI